MLFRDPGFSSEPGHLKLTWILIRVLPKNCSNCPPLPGKGSLFKDLTGNKVKDFSRAPNPVLILAVLKHSR